MKNKMVWNRARISSVAIAVFSLFVIWQTTKIKPTFNMISGSDPGSRVFPYGVAVIMLVCSVLRFITSKEPDGTKFMNGAIGWLRMAALMAVLGTYIFLMPYIGYLLDTALCCTGLVFLMKLQQKFKWYKIIGFGVIVAVILWFVFGRLIGTNLPTGSWLGNLI